MSDIKPLITLIYINTRINAVVVLRVPSTLHGTWISQQYWSTDFTLMTARFDIHVTLQLNRCSTWNRKKTALFCGHYLRNHSTLHIGVLGYIGILWQRTRSRSLAHSSWDTLYMKCCSSLVKELRLNKLNWIALLVLQIVWQTFSLPCFVVKGILAS